MYAIGGRFINGSGFVSSAITWVTNSLWDHFEFWFDEELMALAISILFKHGMPTDYPKEGGYLGAHAGSGIQFRPLNYCTPTRERRYKRPVTPEIFEAFVVAAFKRIGTPYAYTVIGKLLIHNRELTPNTREICSEFGFLAPAEAGFYFLNSEIEYASFITPEILHISPKWMGYCVYKFPT
jgi:hypothetical protein